MMEATALYAELIIIGLETSIWVGMLAVFFSGPLIQDLIRYLLEKVPAAILLLGILYVVGMTMDRAVDWLFKKFEDKIKKQSKMEAPSSIIIWKNSDQENFFLYTRSRIRILRASTLNFPLITISTLCLLWKYQGDRFGMFLFTLVLGLLFSVFAFTGYRYSVKSFYEKARFLELEGKRNQQSPKEKKKS